MNKIILTIVFVLLNVICNAQWKQTSLEGNINGLVERNNSLFAATSMGLYVSTNGGLTFSKIALPSSSGQQYTYSFARLGDSLLVSTAQGILISTTNDTVWTTHFPSFAYGYFFNFHNILINEVSGTFYRSTDKGVSWQTLSTPEPTFLRYSFASDSTNIYYGSDNGILISADSGKTWTKSNVGLGGDTSILSLAYVEGKLIASTNADNNRIYQSTDKGATWKQFAEKPASGFITQMFVIGNQVFANANYGKLHRSTDGGKTWMYVHTGLSNGISTFTSHAIISDTLYVGTGSTSGVWKRALSDFGITSVDNISPEAPQQFALFQNYPNPFNPSTEIRYQMPEVNHVTLKVFDLLGREVATLVDEIKSPGAYKVSFNTKNLSSGVYLYQLRAGVNVETKRMIVVK